MLFEVPNSSHFRLTENNSYKLKILIYKFRTLIIINKRIIGNIWKIID